MRYTDIINHNKNTNRQLLRGVLVIPNAYPRFYNGGSLQGVDLGIF